jgi:hypothetical protein
MSAMVVAQRAADVGIGDLDDAETLKVRGQARQRDRDRFHRGRASGAIETDARKPAGQGQRAQVGGPGQEAPTLGVGGQQ